MSTLSILILLVALAALAYQAGRRRALALVEHPKELPALPGYYGSYVLLWVLLPSLIVLGGWIVLQPRVVERGLIAELPAEVRELPENRLGLYLDDVENLATGNLFGREPDPVLEQAAVTWARLHRRGDVARPALVLLIAVAGFAMGIRAVDGRLRAMQRVEKAFELILGLCSSVAVLTTLGIILSLIFESLRFFQRVPVTEFLFGLEWSPQTALRADQVGSSGSFGAVPLFVGTALISGIALTFAAPIGLFSALYMSEYAAPRTRAIVKPLLEILAGIPTVVYGFFAALTVAPWIRLLGERLGLDVASESALAAGGVMGIMIIPFVSSLSDDVIRAVPRSLREASLALGATKSETVRSVILPAALPGITSGMLLAVSRAIGETMIVVMAAGLAANMTINPLEAVTTVTVQIVTLLVGDQEFDSAKTLAAFALGLLLFVVTLILNIVALHVVRRYQEQYD